MTEWRAAFAIGDKVGLSMRGFYREGRVVAIKRTFFGRKKYQVVYSYKQYLGHPVGFVTLTKVHWSSDKKVFAPNNAQNCS